MNAPQDMLEKATNTANYAYAPYSHFSVGACLRDEHGNLYAGCNIENVAYGSTLCAEAVALGSLIAHGGKQIKEVLIVFASNELCSPCGACRQRLWEFANPNCTVHLCTLDGKYQSVIMKELLPFPFEPKTVKNT